MFKSLQPHQLEALLERLCIGLRLTDGKGAELYGNERWKALVGSLPSEEVDGLARRAAIAGKATMSAGNLLLLSEAIPQTDPLWVLTQVVPEDTARAHGEQAENHHSEDINIRLDKLKLRDCIANSASMIRVFEKAKQVANYPTTVLLVGETGAGKEVVASFIHRNSKRADKAFIKVNCSAIPEQLLESELFGYESGAFTGAKTKGKPGLFELANNGTLLLDEIGDMALPLQAKLLRVLQENEIMRLGGQHVIPLNVRVISSTNRNLKDMLESGQFSEALYYRLNVVELDIPPLRERREDILPLCTFFMSQFCEKYKLDKTFSAEIGECLLRYDWPGNVRELRNIVENIIVSSEKNMIGLEDLPQRMISLGRNAGPPANMPAGTSMRHAVEDLQKDVVTAALEKHGGLRKAAKALDMDPATLHRLAKKLGIPTTP